MIRLPRGLIALVLLTGQAHASAQTGSSSHDLDPLAVLIRSAAPNSWMQITSVGPGAGGSRGLNNDALRRTSANFDGSTSGTSTFGLGGKYVGWGPMAGVGGADTGFSSAQCDLTTLPVSLHCVYWGGGHIDSGDGTVYVLDVKAAAAAVDAGGRGHWIIAVPSGRYIPQTLPKPTGSHQRFEKDDEVSITATFSRGSHTIITPGYRKLTNGRWIGGAGIADYTQVTGCPGGSAYNTSPCTSSTVHITTPTTAAERDARLRAGPDFWVVPAAGYAGNFPISSHSYHSNVMIPGTTKIVLGGFAEFAAAPSGGNTTYFVTDWSAKTMTEYPSVGWSAQTAGWFNQVNTGPCYNPLDEHFYVWGGDTLYKAPRVSLETRPTYTGIIGTGRIYVAAQNELNCIRDPILGVGHEAIFQQMTPDSKNSFALFREISGRPSFSTYEFATRIDSVFKKTSPSYRAYGGGQDAPFLYAWEGDQNLYKVDFSHGFRDVTVTNIATGATGAHPQGAAAGGGVGSDQGQVIYDLGVGYCHAALAITSYLDTYIYKPKGCSL